MQLSAEEQLTRDRLLLLAEWPSLYAIAWRNYQEYGRGLLLLTVGAENMHWKYIPEAALAVIDPGSQALGFVRQYDPESALVCILHHPDHGSCHWLERPVKEYGH
jgi:hypothetical protein